MSEILKIKNLPFVVQPNLWEETPELFQDLEYLSRAHYKWPLTDAGCCSTAEPIYLNTIYIYRYIPVVLNCVP